MAQKLFEDVVNFTLEREGVGSDDPRDRGGPTSYGISKVAHPEAWKDGRPTLGEALAIYERDYWEKAGVATLPPAVAAALFDYRVHSGDSAIWAFQRMLGVKPDGEIGPNTRAAVQAFGEMLVGRELTQIRKANLMKITRDSEEFRRWGQGWSNRCDRVVAFLRELSSRKLLGRYEEEDPAAKPSILKRSRAKREEPLPG